MKVREIIRLVEADGWYHVAARGSHRRYKHPTKAGCVTVAGAMTEEVAPGTRAGMMKQAGLGKGS